MIYGQVAREEENNNLEHRAARMRDAQSRKGGEGSRETAVEESKRRTVDRVARHQAD